MINFVRQFRITMKDKIYSPNYHFVPLKGYENFEATTQIVIAEILKRKLPLEIIDSQNNLIATTFQGKEYIIHEGTISDANSLIAFWISNDKWMTKTFLARHSINHAKGKLLNRKYTQNDLSGFNFPLVVKPYNTDHGLAVSTNIKKPNELVVAIEMAGQYSDKIIVEEYFEGKEYRFLVVDYQTRAVAYRMPANVIGDGIKTIGELISAKNVGRGEDYTHPLLKIKIDHEVERHLIEQKLKLESIPKKDELIFLRKNSNLSTGGDSIDLTEEMPDFYKNIAEKAARAAGLKIAGIDIIIKDIQKSPNNKNYIIVELNAPAMLSMHNFPYVGKNRDVAKFVLDSILNSK